MEDQTFRSRLVELMKKSRKAIRLYGSVYRGGEPSSRFAESQAQEWKNTNAELLRLLTAALDQPGQRQLTIDVISIRDRFEQEWKTVEEELQKLQSKLVSVSQHGDFIKAALLSSDLVVLKARFQAAQAAHHELDDIVRKCRVVGPAIELTKKEELPEAPEVVEPTVRLAKVIPLARR